MSPSATSFCPRLNTVGALGQFQVAGRWLCAWLEGRGWAVGRGSTAAGLILHIDTASMEINGIRSENYHSWRR